ncbi:hypothetical protein MGG_16933 [Pyricularia oryzae 70-15]|uniref:Uncharacterized protein n=1 Tax=Pyricularia oryzae (strain 70-15 / ATCC MYA-4617 / FGSC 8958) TaxID=242507 RepID=G4N138_PYRO7|nr:uncharacterized protein MGG_16933 [Pyricularia oryzae 70-15]EHA53214.1 hypothetical protein MGG_16933 [Pyricularia oryzae 70-15]
MKSPRKAERHSYQTPPTAKKMSEWCLDLLSRLVLELDLERDAVDRLWFN